MESWLLLLLLPTSVFTALCLLFFPSKKIRRLPPGPPAVPVLGNLLWLRHTSISGIEQILKDLHAKHGPIITLRMGSVPYIFISNRALTHKALVELGASFSDRPAPLPATRFLTSNQHNISSAGSGPLWRLFRRNLTAEILTPEKVRRFTPVRHLVLGVLVRDLQSKSEVSPDGAVVVMKSFQFAMFSLLLLMCFGEKLEEKTVREIETAHTNFLLYTWKLSAFSFVPRIAKHVFRRTWKTLLQLKQRQKDLFVPLIRACKAYKEDKQRMSGEQERFVHSYVDSLLDINLAKEGGRGLTEDEIVTLCSEFLTAGTDTTATTLQWIMAELVKHQRVQAKLLGEIENVVGRSGGEEVKEEDLQRMPYLKAVIMEVLRRHPPAHFVLPHSVKEDIEFEGYLIPKKASINFLVAEMGWDERVWEKPMEFMPERFMAGGEGDGVDITGRREIKMMPFGVGRRICPAIGLAMLHLEYFVANLVREFEWDAMDGEEIDFSEKLEFTVAMKNPLWARVSPRNLSYTRCG